MLEREVEGRLGAALRKEGCLFYKWVSPGVSGVPDRICITPSGRITFIELKTARGRVSEQQRVVIGKLRAHGCDVVVLHGMAEALNFVEIIKERERTENRNGNL